MVAVASLAVLALLALTIIEATRGSTRSARAELDRARLSAAADAGIALAVQGLAQANAARRWRPDGRLREVQFGGAAIAIRIEDELGKVPLNQINEQQAEALFSAFGLQGAELEEARDAFLDWRDQDDDPRLRGRERTDYAQDGVRPRDGPLRSNGELAAIPAIGPELAKRMAPYVTVFAPDSAVFAETNASPIARRVMADSVFEDGFAGGAAVADGGLGAAEGARVDDGVTGRPLRIIVRARGEDGSAARRDVVVELTGNPARPYVIRSRE
ncbi:MAG: general secretion pathway protein GspK [Porphyrobacter sp.]|nr:general secretion pathway protein GspK [Porphyrobacter sp.]